MQIGVDICKKYRENPQVIHAIEAHHGDVEPKTTLAFIIMAADAISAARPGARRENMESYIKRLETLEALCNGFEGVESSYAVQAGREVRILVQPDKVSDDQVILLARNVAKKIENELDYPGQIKVGDSPQCGEMSRSDREVWPRKRSREAGGGESVAFIQSFE